MRWCIVALGESLGNLAAAVPCSKHAAMTKTRGKPDARRRAVAARSRSVSAESKSPNTCAAGKSFIRKNASMASGSS
ncbi:hypothetical protein C8Q70DRAFT_58625 [Cubamyces menziesii]|nr:hypothetical protein C8Q70DRAFT_58625 [Cubamyces menziesii]